MMVNICGDIDEGGNPQKCREVNFDSLSDEDKMAYERDNPSPQSLVVADQASTIIEAHQPENSLSEERGELFELLIFAYTVLPDYATEDDFTPERDYSSSDSISASSSSSSTSSAAGDEDADAVSGLESRPK